ncbi:hypothetical protein PA598K_05621 [Paenibacillus sp. 598K]|nr:hypothetical protein PA598K_05621 [Paenibacillus sp. 598K]
MRPHELTAKLSQRSLNLDGKTIQAAPLVMKNDRLYFPLKWLETTGMATTHWDAKTGTAWADFRSENASYFSGVRIKPGDAKLYTYYNNKLEAIEDVGPYAPSFTQNGQLYIHAALLRWIGAEYVWSNNELRITWSDKVVAMQRDSFTTTSDKVTFSVLAQKEFGRIDIMNSDGTGGWGNVMDNLNGTERTVGEPITVGNRTFIRTEYTMDVRPGKTPLQILSQYGGGSLVIHRDVTDPSSVPVRYHSSPIEKDVSFTPDTKGYQRIQAGEAVTVAGTVTTSDIQSNAMTLQLAKYQDGEYRYVGAKQTLPLDDKQQFQGSLTIDEPGYYIVNILSPAVFVGGMTSPYGAVKWAEITVEVLPKGTSPQPQPQPAIGLVINGINYVDADSRYSIYLNEQQRVMVPIRPILQALPAIKEEDLSWNAANQQLTIAPVGEDGTAAFVFKLKVGDRHFTLNGERKEMDSPAVNKNGSIYMPLRAVAEALDLNVKWDAAAKTVDVRAKGK